MKTWFQYEYGYVNLDDKNIYFTNTGNWSDTIDLPEFTPKTNKKTNSTVILGLFALAAVFIYLFMLNILSNQFSIGLLALLGFGGYFTYNYMKTEIGANFKLPYQKLIELERNGDNIDLSFLNIHNEKEVYVIRGVSKENEELLKARVEEFSI